MPATNYRAITRILVLTSALLCRCATSDAAPQPPGTDYAPATFEILKLDPQRVRSNESFVILARVASRVDRALVVSLRQDTLAVPAEKLVQLAPREAQILELAGRLTGTGTHDVTVSAAWQTDETVLKVLPSGKIERRFRFRSLGTRSATLTLQTSDPVRPRFVELGPDADTTSATGYAGVVGTLAGSSTTLFAIPKAAGVWRSINGGPWTPLPGSPPRAHAIAVDPQNRSHLVVGERADDAPDARLGRSGLWESADNGATWTYTYDPTPDASDQAVPAVVFSQTSSALLIATAAGVARRERSTTASPWDGSFVLGTRAPGCTAPSLGPVTALAAAEHRIWARTHEQILWSDDDGRTWSCEAFPPTLDVPGFPGLAVRFDDGSLPGARDSNSIGGFDDRAYLVFQSLTPTMVPLSDPRAIEDGRCDPSKKEVWEPARTSCTFARSSLAIFDPSQPAGSRWLAQFTNDRDGRGANGRRFVKTYVVNAYRCPALADRSIGVGRQLIYSAGQGIQQATGVDASGRLTWDRPVLTNGGEAPGGNGVQTHVHADLWDFHLPDDYCPTSVPTAYLATDGGIDIGTAAPGSSPLISAMKWVYRSEGLRAHTAQDLAVTERTDVVPPPTPGVPYVPVRNVAYPTQDNDGWWRRDDGTWRQVSAGGDANYVVADQTRPVMLMWRGIANGISFIDENGAVHAKTFPTNPVFDGPTRLQAIQSSGSFEPGMKELDLVMLAPLPLRNATQAVDDPPGGSGSGTRYALLRHPHFDRSADGPAQRVDGWTIERDSLPEDTLRFWVAGGHATPTYYLYTGDGNAGCRNGLQRRVAVPSGPVRKMVWTCLIQGLARIRERDGFSSDVSQHGPAFVDPYDDRIVLVTVAAAGTRRASIWITTDGGGHFCELPRLRALLTDNGRYPLLGQFSPVDAYNGVNSRFHGYPFSMPSHVTFNRYRPTELVVASPVGPLLVANLPADAARNPIPCDATGWLEPAWRDLRAGSVPALPYVSATAIVGDSVVLSSEGRGAFAIANRRSAPVATYVETENAIARGNSIATLLTSAGAPVPWTRVTVALQFATSRGAPMPAFVARTDAGGQVLLPAGVPDGDYVADVRFAGDSELGGTAARFRLSVHP